jgi:hypothetical protein
LGCTIHCLRKQLARRKSNNHLATCYHFAREVMLKKKGVRSRADSAGKSPSEEEGGTTPPQKDAVPTNLFKAGKFSATSQKKKAEDATPKDDSGSSSARSAGPAVEVLKKKPTKVVVVQKKDLGGEDTTKNTPQVSAPPPPPPPSPSKMYLHKSCESSFLSLHPPLADECAHPPLSHTHFSPNTPTKSNDKLLKTPPSFIFWFALRHSLLPLPSRRLHRRRRKESAALRKPMLRAQKRSVRSH